MVVASILIAFGLDAWWDGVSERRQLRDQLAGVVRELEAGRDQLEEAIVSNRILGDAAEALRRRIAEPEEGAAVEVPDSLVGALFSHFVMDVSTSATVGFIEAGGLALVDRPELATPLRNWPDAMADAVDDQTQLRLGVQSGYQPYMLSAAPLGNALETGADMIRRSYLAEEGAPVPEFRNPPGSITLRSTPELTNHLSWRIAAERTRGRQMQSLLEAQDSLISGLRAVLER